MIEILGLRREKDWFVNWRELQCACLLLNSLRDKTACNTSTVVLTIASSLVLL